ncbi:K02A2.6-like [Cordylochernes scorpioides]|uniref:RNA-directed DNA polymerase n=1 Tax=Cordylochernes scorpioides TaxID=51811 RepID=A0ABY6KXQ7_9ARAC|nr:K02A2.6-like [Cordylochernes scorpioides]
MLSQLKNGTPQPITFYSHKFRGAELNYSTIEKECLAIIMAIEQFDYYIYGQQVEIYCDHKPLQYLKSLENKNRRLMKWALMLQDRELTFFHVKGKENAMADWLSRDTYNTEVAVVNVYGGVTTIPNYEKSMLNCPVWKNIYKRALSTDSEVEEGDGTYFISKSTRYLVKVSPDSRPTRKGRMVKQIVIPPVLRDTILERCHDSPIEGHLSVEKTLYAVLSHYYWKGAMPDVRRYVKTCPVCAENNGRLKKAPNMPIQPANYPFERLCVDFVGPLTLSRNRNRYLLVFIDAFTRYAEVIPARDCTAETAGLEFVNKIVEHAKKFYLTVELHSSQTFSERYLSTTSYRPTCNSIVERVNGTICSILRHYTNSRNWEDNLGAAVAAYNNTVHSALGESPHYRLFGYDAVNHEVSDKDVSEFRKPSLAERLKEMQDARETVRKFLSENYDERVKKYKTQTVRTFETGDLVLLAVPKGKGSSKFSAKFYGPFRVVAKVSEVNFRVRGVNLHDEQVVHIDRMKAFRGMRHRKPTAAKRECYPRRRMIPLAREGGSACRISPRREMSTPPLETKTVPDQEKGDSHDEPTVVDGAFDRAHFSPYFLRPNPRPADPR